jgi:hypothetical protein
MKTRERERERERERISDYLRWGYNEQHERKSAGEDLDP